MPNSSTTVWTNGKPNSVLKVKLKVLTFEELWGNYPKDTIIHRDPKSHEDIFSDHCAIHLSECLYKSGVQLKSFRGTRCWSCPSGKRKHAIRAQELATWLNKRPFAGCPKANSYKGENYRDGIDDRKGIIFFKDYWQRENEKKTKIRTGDHIDLWNGSRLAGDFIGSIIRVTLNLSVPGIYSDFKKSKEILFWEIK